MGALFEKKIHKYFIDWQKKKKITDLPSVDDFTSI